MTILPALRRFAFALLLLLGCTAAADGSGEAGNPAPPGSVALADVIVDGRLVMKVRGTASFPAARRAAEIRQNIIEVARDERIPADAVTIQVEDERTLLMAGSRMLLDMLDADAAIEGLSRQLLAEIRQERVQEVIAAYRRDRTPEELLTEGVYALATILVAAALIFAFWKASRALAGFLDRRFKRQIKDLEAKSASLIRYRNLTAILHTLTRAAFLVLVALTLYLSINYVLGLFPWTRGLASQLFDLILNPLEEMGLGLLAAIPDLIWLVILFFITRYVLGMIRTFFRGIENGSVKLASFDRELALPTYRIVRLLVIVRHLEIRLVIDNIARTRDLDDIAYQLLAVFR